MVEIALKGDFPLESTLTLGPSAVVHSLWIVAEGEASLRFAPRGGRRLDEGGLAAPLIETAPGAPPLFLDGVRLHGPVRIDGSRASLRNCTIEDVNEGAALMASNGATVVLRDGTLLRGRSPSHPNAKSLVVDDSSSVHYQLPAPLGRYINAPNGDEEELTSVEGDFPFACAPGVSGASDDRSAQNGPQCSGLCPAGKMCPGATAEPEPCSAGGYCAEGSPTAVPCEPGTYIDDKGAKSKSACAPCPTGAWCAAGESFPCERGFFNALPNQGDPDACERCPDVRSTTADVGSSSAGECVCKEGYYAIQTTSNATSSIRCETCTASMNCTASGTTLEGLRLRSGQWRLSEAAATTYRCAEQHCQLLGKGITHTTERSGIDGLGCREGHRGPLCATCADGWASGLEGVCELCGDETRTRSAVVMAGVGVAALVILAIAVPWYWFKAKQRRGRALGSTCAVTRSDCVNGTRSLRIQLPSDPPLPVHRVCHGQPSARSMPHWSSSLPPLQLEAPRGTALWFRR